MEYVNSGKLGEGHIQTVLSLQIFYKSKIR